MTTLDQVKPNQILYSTSSPDKGMPWRKGVHRIRVMSVVSGDQPGVVASWNNHRPRFFPEERVRQWLTAKPADTPAV